MVLKRGFLGALLVSLAGCVHTLPPQQATGQPVVAVAFVQDQLGGPGVDDVPDALKSLVAESLRKRNLDVQVVPFSQVEDAFSRVHASARRFTWLKEATRAPWVVLVETRAEFFSLLSGRYRWEVQAKVTAAGRGSEAQPATRDLQIPAILVFDHEREPDAIAQAAPPIADAAGSVMDDLIASLPALPPEGTVPTEPPPAPPKELPPGSRAVPKPQASLGTGAIYFVMVDRFADGDPSNDGKIDRKDPAAFHGGDLQGVLDHLDDLQKLGVSTVWLSPVFQMRTEKFYGFGAFHGYWVEDLRKLEPRFGNEALLRRLSDALHARGMKLVLDLVLNHVGPDTKLVKEKPDWFHHAGPLTDWNDPKQLVTRDVDGLPDLAQEKPEVYRYLLDASVHWLEVARPDGFRLDAVKHMPLAFWARFTRDIRARAGDRFLLLGEMLEGDPQVLARVEQQGGFNALFDFPLEFAVVDVFCKDQPPSRIASILSSDRLYADPFSLVTLVDNHDLPRVASLCKGDLSRIEQALRFILTARGTPSLTWGTEVELKGEKEPQNRGDMRFVDHPLEHFISKVLSERRAHPSLQRGVPMFVELDGGLYAYARVTPDEVALIAVNRGDAPATVTPPDAAARWTEADSGARASRLTVPARQTRIWFSQAPTPGAYAQLAAQARAEWRGEAGRRRVTFKVEGLDPKQGEHLEVVGSGPELGAWKPAHGKVSADGQTVTAALPVGSVYEYKFVVKKRDGSFQWQPGANRSLEVGRGAGALQVALEWNGPAEARAERK